MLCPTYASDVIPHRSLDAMAGSSWTQSKWSQNYINGSNYANDLPRADAERLVVQPEGEPLRALLPAAPAREPWEERD